ncbi:hypothetical protein DDV98_04965 [Streptomyces sp. IB2014 011-12]|nr:hypothetical protein STIB_03150 [Streptomyces sp. IB2014 011-1]RDV53013.1 hypothetical protein DDV98_04965 [Streptomyces sp. IB2014 011-12]
MMGRLVAGSIFPWVFQFRVPFLAVTSARPSRAFPHAVVPQIVWQKALIAACHSPLPVGSVM